MSSRKPRNAQPKYEIHSTPYQKVRSPFRQPRRSPYPDEYIFYNRKIKTRPFEFTKPTNDVSIPSEIDADSALDLYETVTDTAVKTIQSKFRRFFEKYPEYESTEQDEKSKTKTRKFILSLHE